MKKKQSDSLKTAIKLLSIKDRTEVELREKLLKKGFKEKDIKNTIEYLKQKGFIDDNKFIREASKIAEEKLLGEMGVKNYLLRKGISGELIDSLPKLDEFTIAQRLIKRKEHLLKEYSDEKRKQKIAGFLLRRGFSWDTVNRCIKSYTLNKDSFEKK